MENTQAWGWLAAGVLALGLNGIYQDGDASWAHRAVNEMTARIAGRSEAVLALASGRADWFMTKANLVAAPNETGSCRFSTAVARFQARIARTQTGLASLEAMSAREEAQFARLEANRARVEAQFARVRFAPAFNMREIPTICPRVRVSIPRVPVVRIPAPRVHLDMPGAGPV
jgi:hypothetical protein